VQNADFARFRVFTFFPNAFSGKSCSGRDIAIFLEKMRSTLFFFKSRVPGYQLNYLASGLFFSATFLACEPPALAYRGRVLGQLSIPAFGSAYLSGLPCECAVRTWLECGRESADRLILRRLLQVVTCLLKEEHREIRWLHFGGLIARPNTRNSRSTQMQHGRLLSIKRAVNCDDAEAREGSSKLFPRRPQLFSPCSARSSRTRAAAVTETGATCFAVFCMEQQNWSSHPT